MEKERPNQPHSASEFVHPYRHTQEAAEEEEGEEEEQNWISRNQRAGKGEEESVAQAELLHRRREPEERFRRPGK